MRPTNNVRRPRGRPNRKQQHGSPRHQTFDSHGPEVRIRGNAPQVYEKYLSLARDATSSGDRVLAEGFFQFAEHYFRIMNDSTDPRRPSPPNQTDGRNGQEGPSDHELARDQSSQHSGPANAEHTADAPDMEQPFVDPAETSDFWPAAGEAAAEANSEKADETPGGDGEENNPPPRRAARGRGRRRPANGSADGKDEGAAAKNGASKEGDSAAVDDSDSEAVTP